MPQPVALPATTPVRNFPERIVINETERAEQFAAFLRARAGEDSPAPGRAAERSQALPPPARFDWNPRARAASPVPWARAHEVANGKPFVSDAPGVEVLPAPDDDGTPEPPATSPTQPDGSTEPENPGTETPGASTSGDATAPGSSDSSSASFAAPFAETEPTFQPNTPRYQDVPDVWKWPIGPYQQAPEEFGGQWWKVNPFTGSEPWRPPAESAGSRPSEPAEEFLAVFGPRPEARDFDGVTAYRAARGRWDQDLAYFKQSGIPEGFDESQVERATNFFETWGMGRPAFYEGRHGWAVRFPESGLPAFEANASTALGYSHLIVAGFQIRQLLNGVDPAKRHPFVPPMLKAENV